MNVFQKKTKNLNIRDSGGLNTFPETIAQFLTTKHKTEQLIIFVKMPQSSCRTKHYTQNHVFASQN